MEISKLKNSNLISSESNETKNLNEQRLENSLNLRKRKINDILSKKRGFDKFKKDGVKGYKLVKEELNIPYQIKNKIYDDVDHFLKDMKHFIQLDNVEYNKYALYCIRFQTINDERIYDKNLYTENLLKENIVCDILNLIYKYFDNKSIIFEGIWILINTLYYQKDNLNLVLFLSNEKSIQLYIKILDKKDNQLRLNLYCLLLNLLCNKDYGLTNEVLLHFYMSGLFKLYIIKDLHDMNSKLTEDELIYLLNILVILSQFIIETNSNLKVNDIKIFTNYNSTVNYNSLKEYNNYLLENSLLIFINYINNPNLTSYCLLGLSKLSNLLDTSTYKILNDSNICNKIIKGHIKVEEEFVNNAVQLIGNFLMFTPFEYIVKNSLEEILFYFKTFTDIS